MTRHFRRFNKSLSPYFSYYESFIKQSFGEQIPPHLAYLCPLCLKHIIIITDKKEGLTSAFTVDHYPPQNVNGKNKILVCKDCNNSAGHSYEHVLVDRLNMLSFINQDEKGVMKVSARMEGMKGYSRAKVEIDDDKVPVITLGNEQKLPFIKDWFSKMKDKDAKIYFSGVLPDERKVQRALLKAAYLYCFEAFGYEFVFSKNGGRLRALIHSDEEQPVPQLWKHDNTEGLPEGVCYISDPKEIKAFAVLMHLKTKQSVKERLAIVLIPGPSDVSWEQVTKLKEKFDNSNNLQLTFEPLNPIDLSQTLNAYSATYAVLAG